MRKEDKNMIEIKEDVRIPGTDVILEAGDKIEILREGVSNLSDLITGLQILQKYDPYATISNRAPKYIGVDSKLLRSISNPDSEKMDNAGWEYEVRLNRWMYQIGD